MPHGMSLDTLPAKRRKSVRIVRTFVPAFWEDVDGRLLTVRRIKKRLAALRRDAHVDSMQKDMLCQRAVFLALQLETQERKAAEGQPVDTGQYTQMCNGLLGLLRALGLAPKHHDKKVSLREYIDEQDADKT